MNETHTMTLAVNDVTGQITDWNCGISESV